MWIRYIIFIISLSVLKFCLGILYVYTQGESVIFHFYNVFAKFCVIILTSWNELGSINFFLSVFWESFQKLNSLVP